MVQQLCTTTTTRRRLFVVIQYNIILYASFIISISFIYVMITAYFILVLLSLIVMIIVFTIIISFLCYCDLHTTKNHLLVFFAKTRDVIIIIVCSTQLTYMMPRVPLMMRAEV